MTRSPLRIAVSPLRRGRVLPAPAVLPALDDVVARERPQEPLHALRPATLRRAARRFVEGFPGDTLYAVKCNADPRVLRALRDGGVRHFDCASPAEIALVRSMFGREAAIHYMHPVRARAAIREAFHRHAVRDFVLDSEAELGKLLDETGARPGELVLVVRIALPKASPGLYVTASLGITFPFNLVVGIPLYIALAEALTAAGLRDVQRELASDLLRADCPGDAVAAFARPLALDDAAAADLAAGLVRAQGTTGPIELLVHRTRVRARR